MNRAQAKYFDGKSSREFSGVVIITSQQVSFESSDGLKVVFSRGEIKPHAKLGTSIRVLDCTGGGRLEIQANPNIDKLIYPPSKGIVHCLEQNSQAVAFSIIGILAFVGWAYFWGIPLAAEKIVPMIPKEVSLKMGNEAIKAMKQYGMLNPSQLSKERQTKILAQLRTMSPPPSKIPVMYDFTQAGIPNAFALPNGQVFITDKLVEVLPTIEHIRAVAWHEIGHVHHEHSMKILAKSAALAVLFFAVTGGGADVSTLPLLLMNQSYSREAESQADQFAADNMQKEGLDPALLAEALEAIEAYVYKKRRSKTKNDDAWDMPPIFSSHPLTKERAEFLRSY